MKATLCIARLDPLRSLRQWFDATEIHHLWLAKLICLMIPAHCPFARDVKILGRSLFSVPPLCEFNPFYAQFISLRLKSLTYLAEHDEDVTRYF
jgi:hypothetical protein